jgi:hypothetical protein
MSKPGSFPYLLDCIFGELNEASGMILEFKTANPVLKIPCLKVVSVNGYTSGSMFKNWLINLCLHVIDQIGTEIKSMNQIEKEQFLQLSLKYARRLSCLASGYNVKNNLEKNINNEFSSIFLRRVKCLIDGSAVSDPVKIDQLLSLATRYFVIWQHFINELIATVNIFLCYIRINPENDSINTPSEGRIKYHSGTTVACLATRTRIDFECNLFQTKNKLEICRQAVGVYSTPNQPYISPNSFKTYFYYPPLEILDQVEKELLLKTKILKRLKAQVIRDTGLKKVF